MRTAVNRSGCSTHRSHPLGWLVRAAALLALLSACGGPPKAPPTTVAGSVAAVTGVNPSVSGRPSPLLLRVYELKTDTVFAAADFVSLYQRDQAELGADLVGREEIMLAPGESRPINRTLAPETRFLAVFAAYRDVEHARWRAVLAVRPGQAQRITIRASELAVTVELAP
jgi:type VI secretion system protein VasD